MSYTGKLPDRILKLDEKQNYQKAAEWDEWPRIRPTIPVEGIPHDEEPDSKD
jgi:hypothetical protein